MKTITFTEKTGSTKTEDYYTSALCNRTGLIVSAALIAFFLVMRLLNLHEILTLRYFNFVFLFAGIGIALYQYKRKKSINGVNYLKGLKMGFYISLLAAIPFALFMGVYLAIDDSFMAVIRNNADLGEFLTPVITAGSISIEILSLGAITTFLCMQYLKKSN